MLIQVTFENVLSFRDETTFSMIAGDQAQQRAEWTRPGPDGLRLLKVAGVYGANAAGKSNLVNALGKLVVLLHAGRRADEEIEISPFKLDESRDRPSRAQLDVWTNGTPWSYSIQFSRTQVLEEALWRGASGGDEELVFSRTTNEKGSSNVNVGPALRLDREQRQFLDFVARGTRPNQPFIAEARDRNATFFEDFTRWLTSRVFPYGTKTNLRESWAKLAMQDPRFLRFLESLLVDTGTGVRQLQVKVDVPMERLRDVAELSGDRLLKVLDDDKNRKYFAFVQGSGQDALSEQEQSDGTLRLLDLASLFFRVEAGADSTMVIDELDRALHALASRKLIERFLEMAGDGDHQLIFTTHDTSLLDHRLLPPESIWFAEKDPRGATHLYSLAEFNPIQLKQLEGAWERGYLHGRFGAIPFASDPERLGWIGRR